MPWPRKDWKEGGTVTKARIKKIMGKIEDVEKMPFKIVTHFFLNVMGGGRRVGTGSPRFDHLGQRNRSGSLTYTTACWESLAVIPLIGKRQCLRKEESRKGGKTKNNILEDSGGNRSSLKAIVPGMKAL